MNDYPPRANFFDASALVKVFTNEYDNTRVQEYFYKYSPTKFTTPFCFYESLNILKSKWKYRNELTKEEYIESSFKLTAWYSHNSRFKEDLDFSDAIVFDKIKNLVKKHSLDLSDAFQLLTVIKGAYSNLIDESKTLLITADKDLAKAARLENVKVWCCSETDYPDE